MIISRNIDNSFVQIIFNNFTITKATPATFNKVIGAVSFFNLNSENGDYSSNNLYDLLKHLTPEQRQEVIWAINEF